MSRHRWIGIDEAGYGPNIGPLVMAAVVAESDDDREPDLWGDLPDVVCRAGGPTDRLWIDDSKAILKGRKGRDRLNHAALSVIRSTAQPEPTCLSEWLTLLGAGSFEAIELAPWLTPGHDPAISPQLLPRHSLVHQNWRIASVHAIVIGPDRFNQDIDETNSKAAAHFRAFSRLLRPLWDDLEVPALARCDKHGGRNFYLGPLSESFPDVWIDRGEEGPSLSRYVIRGDRKHLTLEFRPRADAESGLVALASIVAKAIREEWMEAFNRFWGERIPGLRPTAGYPVDASRFRKEIGATADELGLTSRQWWRTR